jgi:tetratricopeptide (TPR) repeat protein
MRADAYIGLKMYEEALADYDKGVELGPFRSYTYKRRAVVHFHLKNYDQALADIAKAVELLPGDTSNLTWIPPAEVAKCPDESFRRGILDVADKAIELNSDAAWAYSLHAQRGLLFAAFGQEDKALADLKAAVEGIPKADESDEQRFSPCYELGSLCVGLAHREETLPYLVRMVDLQPKQPTARYRCALAQLRVSQGAAYNATCRAAVEQFRQTSDAEAAFWTAWTCSLAPNAVDDFSASVALAERAVKNDSKSVGYLSTLGAILHRAGKHEEAIRRLEEADRLIRHPNSESSHSPAYTWFFLAMAHEAAGRHDEAKKWFDKAAAWTNTALREDDEGVKPLAWNRRFTLKLLRDEAEELLKTPVGKQEPPRPPAGKETTKNQ